jgi:hypothetical protein
LDERSPNNSSHQHFLQEMRESGSDKTLFIRAYNVCMAYATLKTTLHCSRLGLAHRTIRELLGKTESTLRAICMEHEIEVVRLLTEIRDNQQRQLEAHQKSQRDYIEFYNAALAKQQRRAVIVAVVIGLGLGLIALGLMMR